MPWQEHRIVDLRMEFVLRAKARGANVAELCRDYQVSRKTGYKWLKRFDESGVEGLREMSRRPRRVVETSGELVLRTQELRHAHPRWGPKKLRVLLQREFASKEVPSIKTIARVLERLGEPRLRAWRRHPKVATHQAVSATVKGPNDLWTVDFKGWWRTKQGDRCEPLTVRDAFSRFVLAVKVMSTTGAKAVREVFERLFEQYGLPTTIHVDNGQPFGSVRARGRLTELSAWWVSLGVHVEFSRPAHPEDNGAHERMHGDMRFELEDHPSDDLVDQQQAFDAWVHEFNHVRPHEALRMSTPAAHYRRSVRPYRGPRKPRYPARFFVRRVAVTGHIKIAPHRVFVGSGLRRHTVGVESVDTNTVRVWFYDLDLGEADLVDYPRGRRSSTSTAASSAPCAGSSKRKPTTTRIDRDTSSKRRSVTPSKKKGAKETRR
jgi:putative transposase